MGTVSPKIQVVEYGGIIKLRCNSNDQIEWMFNMGTSKWQDIVWSSKRVKITPATYSDSGNYTCVGLYRDDTNKLVSFIATAHVYVGRRWIIMFF